MLTLALACTSPEAPPPPPAPPVVTTPTPPPAPPLPADYKAPPIVAFGGAELWRRAHDEVAAREGQFNRIEVRVSWPVGAEDPVVGAAITLVPVAALPPVELTIAAARKESEPEIGEYWEIALTPLTDPRYLSAPAAQNRRPEYPFDAVFLSPAQPKATLLSVPVQPLGDLPPEARHADVRAAVDTSGDSRPDAVELAFCCERRRALDACDTPCGETWLLRDGDWVKIGDSQPM